MDWTTPDFVGRLRLGSLSRSLKDCQRSRIVVSAKNLSFSFRPTVPRLIPVMPISAESQ